MIPFAIPLFMYLPSPGAALAWFLFTAGAVGGYIWSIF